MSRRTVTPFINLIRVVCRGRQLKEALRFQDALSSRNQPPPSIPGGPYHKLQKISYYSRDARREVQPPREVFNSEIPQLATGNENPAIPSK